MFFFLINQLLLFYKYPYIIYYHNFFTPGIISRQIKYKHEDQHTDFKLIWIVSHYCRFLPSRCRIGQSPNPAGISILVPDLLLHFGIGQGFQERSPLIRFTGSPERYLYGGQRCFAKGIRSLMPRELPANRIRNCRDKLPA